MPPTVREYVLSYLRDHDYCHTKIIREAYPYTSTAQNVKAVLRKLESDELIRHLGRRGRTDFYTRLHNINITLEEALEQEDYRTPKAANVTAENVTIYAGLNATPEYFLSNITSRSPAMFHPRFDWKTKVELAMVKLIANKRAGYRQDELDECHAFLVEYAQQVRRFERMITSFVENDAVIQGIASDALSDQTVNHWATFHTRED